MSHFFRKSRMISKKTAGFSFIEVLVGTTIVALAFLTLVTISQWLNKSFLRQSMYTSLAGLSENIQGRLFSNALCSANFSFVTPMDSSQLSASRSATGVPVQVVIDPSTSVAAGQNLTEFRINVTGFNLTNVIDIDLSMVPRLRFGILRASFQSDFKIGGVENFDRIVGGVFFSMDAADNYTGQCYLSDTPTVTCTALGGTYDASATPPCSFPVGIPACPAGQYLTGVAAGGTPTCITLSGTCVAGSYISGFNAAGTAICTPLPL